jgi:hypothetical protein
VPYFSSAAQANPFIQRIEDAVAAHGLIVRGGFDFRAEEEAPPGPDGLSARSVVLVGNAGDRFWPHFRKWLAGQPAGIDDPLDTWSRMVLEEVASAVGARVLMPNDRPHAPFQQWAVRAEGLRSSPLGILMHPEYGLWHAYRGALLFDRSLGLEKSIPEDEKPNHICASCIEKPCMNSCPANAFMPGLFDHEACLSHIEGIAGCDCMDNGCLARNACPEHGYRYGPELQAFLMLAYRRALRRQNAEP